jgi:hypothetical protein
LGQNREESHQQKFRWGCTWSQNFIDEDDFSGFRFTKFEFRISDDDTLRIGVRSSLLSTPIATKQGTLVYNASANSSTFAAFTGPMISFTFINSR